MREVEAIQREVWGLADIDVVPAAQLKAAMHAGGQAAGAFMGDEMVGFSYGLAARPHGRGMQGAGLHSHMVAVREVARQRGVGKALKWYQRRWCLERDLAWITWTFDPLQARNANLNFKHLGVVSNEYLVDFYGAMAGPLGADASDRLVALWLLDSVAVRRRAESESLVGSGEVAAAPAHGLDIEREHDRAMTVTVLSHHDATLQADVEGQGGSAARVAGNAAFHQALADRGVPTRLLVAVPHDIGALRKKEPAKAADWRAGLRAAIIPALEAGFSLVDFTEGSYVLERVPTP